MAKALQNTCFKEQVTNAAIDWLISNPEPTTEVADKIDAASQNNRLKLKDDQHIHAIKCMAIVAAFVIDDVMKAQENG